MRRPRSLLLAAAAPALIALACETVDLGNPPADINACRPSQSYYVGVQVDGGLSGGIWEKILDMDFGGKRCANPSCHGTGSTNSLKLTMPTSCTPPACPIPLTQEMADNYVATAEQMNCSNVTASKLLEYPSGIRLHGGGKLFEPNGMEADLIIGWISALP